MQAARIILAALESFAETLDALVELGPAGIARFEESLDPTWIDQALEATGTASIRRRKIPANLVVWLVLGMALFANRSIIDLVEHLHLVLPGVRRLSKGAVPPARYRLGPRPVRWLFERVAGAWSSTPEAETWRGLQLYGIDGTHLRVQDTDENFEHFGKPGGRGGAGDSGYPQLRLVCLMNLGNRMLAGADFGPWSSSEQALGRGLVDLLPRESLTIVDRGFAGYETYAAIVGPGRHLMTRLRADQKPVPLKELPDGTLLVEFRPCKRTRQQFPDLPPAIRGRVIAYQHDGGKASQLFVTLTDAVRYPAEELVALYHERWELENGFDEVKTHMLERRESLRSLLPEGVEQELWGLLLAYNLVRREMLLAAQEHGLPAARMSFRSSLLFIRNFWIMAATTRSPGNLPRHLGEFRSTLDVLFLPPRRSKRRYPRHVKIKMSNYPRNRGRRSAPGSQGPTEAG